MGYTEFKEAYKVLKVAGYTGFKVGDTWVTHTGGYEVVVTEGCR